ncbi:MAG: DUF5606 domain-containing protein [Candidatus Competibacteraceae bacterium]|nr:DUF5606 domain-containing protein [Candidatus Competibacteraceae bacterium]
MEFEKLVSISGQSSLYLVISKTANGFIAESLEDKKRIPVFQNMDVSMLEDISIYTESGEVTLKSVFLKVLEKYNGKDTPDAKADNAELFRFFEEVLPDFDKEKVYASHIRKIVKWYSQLLKLGMIDSEKLSPKEESKTEESETSEDKPKTDEKKKEAKTAKPKSVTVATKSTGAVKNAPARKVQTVRKAGGA